MEKLVLIIWIALYPVACSLGRYIYFKRRKMLGFEYDKDDKQAELLATITELIIYVCVWSYLTP